MNFQSKFLHNHAASVICWGRGDILNYIVRFIIRSDGPIGFFPFGHFSDHHSFDSEVALVSEKYFLKHPVYGQSFGLLVAPTDTADRKNFPHDMNQSRQV